MLASPKWSWPRWLPYAALAALVLAWTGTSLLQSRPADKDKPAEPPTSSYDQIAPVLLGKESFEDVMAKDKADKPAVMARQKKLLEERYDLTPQPDSKVKMSRGKPIQVGPAARLPEGMTWEQAGRDVARGDPGQGPVPQGLPAPAPPQARGGRHGLPADGDQAAAAAGALRRRFRPARALPAGVPARHLPDDPARPGRRVAGQARDGRELPGDLRRASSTPRTWRACGCW